MRMLAIPSATSCSMVV